VASNVLPALDAYAKLAIPSRGVRRSGGKEALKALTEGVRGLIGYFFNGIGQNENPALWGSCQLPPAADIPLNWLSSESCHSTKSLRDSGGVRLGRSAVRRAEIADSERGALSESLT